MAVRVDGRFCREINGEELSQDMDDGHRVAAYLARYVTTEKTMACAKKNLRK